MLRRTPWTILRTPVCFRILSTSHHSFSFLCLDRETWDNPDEKTASEKIRRPWEEFHKTPWTSVRVLKNIIRKKYGYKWNPTVLYHDSRAYIQSLSVKDARRMEKTVCTLHLQCPRTKFESFCEYRHRFSSCKWMLQHQWMLQHPPSYFLRKTDIYSSTVMR